MTTLKRLSQIARTSIFRYQLFLDDFMFLLTKEELDELFSWSQIATLKDLKSQNAISILVDFDSIVCSIW